MKRIDKNKVYAFIGRAVVYSSLYIAAVAGTVWAFLQNTIYQEVKYGQARQVLRMAHYNFSKTKIKKKGVEKKCL